MAEAKEDMKFAKFDILIEEIQFYFYPLFHSGSCGCSSNVYALLMFKPKFINQYISSNTYVAIVEKLFADNHQDPANFYINKYKRNSALEYISDVLNNNRKDTSIIDREIGAKKNGSHVVGSDVNYRLDSYALVFWLFFLAAIDEDIYNNEFSSIIDLAYCLKFDEPMIRDWCNAVKYVLEGNHLNKACDLQCATDAGKKFFLHQY